MTDLKSYLRGVRERMTASKKYTDSFQFAAHDKIELIGQTGALLIVTKSRLTDLATLAEICETLMEAVEFYASGQHALSEANDGGRARQAKVRVEEILEGKK